MHNHHPIYCILPPHVLKKIAENGTAGQRDRALHTMNMSEQLRGRRNAMSQMVAFAVLAAGEEQKTRTVSDARFGSSLPGTVARKEGDPPVADVTVNEAYDGS